MSESKVVKSEVRSDLLTSLSQSAHIVLVETSHSGNIGAVARSMKNMGICSLRLVSPKSYPSEEAKARASGADDVLSSAQVFHSLSEAVADCHRVVGASARLRSFPWPVVSPRELAEQSLDLITGVLPQDEEEQKVRPSIAYVFGRESSGLTNQELQQCDTHVHIPANPDYSSLNLAMAVQVVAYELRMQALSRIEGGHEAALLSPDDEGWDALPSTHLEIESMLEHFERVMIRSEFYDPNNPGLLMPRLRRLFQRRGLDKMEVNILRGILKSIEKKWDR